MSITPRLQALDDANKQRKVNYPVAGSLVKFISETSTTWIRTGSGNVPINMRIKFMPDRTQKGYALVDLRPQVSGDNNFSTTWRKICYRNEPQTGDGSIILNLTILTQFGNTDFYIRAVATGTSGGKFSLL